MQTGIEVVSTFSFFEVFVILSTRQKSVERKGNDNIDDCRGRAHSRQPKDYLAEYERFKTCAVFRVLSS